ncbi:hypothetical protein [Streptomyces sp. NPDC001404]|uniref:hypothetical protein n=1 Tax=Streptomyces sp. NPDC001404 TaxID=3364571 RepID=UPI0036C41547
MIGLVDTWPFALTAEHGELHTLNDGLDPRTWENGKYAPGVALAEREADRLGVPPARAHKGTAAIAPANENKEN